MPFEVARQKLHRVVRKRPSQVNNHIDTLDGTIATDPEGSGTTILNGAEVDGQVITESWNLPVPIPPTASPFDVSKGELIKGIVLHPSDNGKYDYILMTNKKVLDIHPTAGKKDGMTLYVTGNVTLDQSSELQIHEYGSLVLYLGGDLTVNNQSNVNISTGDPKKCIILGVTPGQVITIQNNVTFYGVIYAPGAYVYLDNSSQFYGAVIADNVSLRNHSELNYDQSLKENPPLTFGLKFVVDRWWQGEEW